MTVNLEQIIQIGKPKHRDLTVTRLKLKYKLIGYFDTHRVNEALKVEAYLSNDPYFAKPIGYGFVAIYKRIYR